MRVRGVPAREEPAPSTGAYAARGSRRTSCRDGLLRLRRCDARKVADRADAGGPDELRSLGKLGGLHRDHDDRIGCLVERREHHPGIGVRHRACKGPQELVGGDLALDRRRDGRPSCPRDRRAQGLELARHFIGRRAPIDLGRSTVAAHRVHERDPDERLGSHRARRRDSAMLQLPRVVSDIVLRCVARREDRCGLLAGPEQELRERRQRVARRTAAPQGRQRAGAMSALPRQRSKEPSQSPRSYAAGLVRQCR